MGTSDWIQTGNRAFSAGDYARALLCYQRALELVRGDPDLLADLHGNLANVHAVTGQGALAVEHYQKAIAILRGTEDYGRLGTTFVNLGNLHADQGDPASAIHFYQQATVLLESQEKWAELVTLYGNLSLMSLKREDPNAALQYAEKGAALAREIHHPERLADALHRLAKANGALGRVQIAEGISQAAYRLYAQANNDMGCAATLYHQASLYEVLGRLTEAIRCLERVVAIDERYDLPKLAENREWLSRLRRKADPERPT